MNRVLVDKVEAVIRTVRPVLDTVVKSVNNTLVGVTTQHFDQKEPDVLAGGQDNA